MSVNIRSATAADRSACIDLLGKLTQATGGRSSTEAGTIFDQLLSTERGAVIVADEDGTLLGMASVSYNLAMRYGGEYCQLEELIVDPTARGKNVGGLLVTATIDRARERGCGEYGLYLVASTEHNEPFYQKYGPTKVGSEMRMPL